MSHLGCEYVEEWIKIVTLKAHLNLIEYLKEIHGLQPLKGSCCVLMILLQVVQSERGFRSLMS